MRGGDTSEVGQMSYILGNPIAYAQILFRNIFHYLPDFVLGKDIFSVQGHLAASGLTWISAALAIYVVVTDTRTTAPVSYTHLKMCIASLLATCLSGIAGVIGAYKGLGTWALVVQQLGNQFLLMAFLWILVGWKPERKFSMERVKTLFSYGWKLMCSSLIDTVYNNLYTMAVSYTHLSYRGQKYSRL